MVSVVDKFSKRLKLLRKQKKMKQTDMATFLKCHVRHYQRIEHGEVNVPCLDLIVLADYFDVSLDYLVGRSENPKRY
jgi:transcriptional regulator with XRE-family HTH domain